MECGECNLCCKLLDVNWMNSPTGEWCEHATPGKGCSIHDTKDDKCREFECSYYQMENVSTNLRPDKCHVIFEKIADDMFLGTKDHHYATKKDFVGQIKSFLKQGYSIVIQNGRDKPAIFPKEGKQARNVYFEFKKLAEAKQNDNTILHN
jgi:hypothetical protein